MASGLNALAHCVDSMWAPRADPINQALAPEGIRALDRRAARGGGGPAGWLAGSRRCTAPTWPRSSFASAGSGLHHKICHVLGGTFNLPHAQTHATVLPYVLAFNAPAAPDAGGPDGRRASAPATAVSRRPERPARTPWTRRSAAASDYGFTRGRHPRGRQLILKPSRRRTRPGHRGEPRPRCSAPPLTGTTPAAKETSDHDRHRRTMPHHRHRQMSAPSSRPSKQSSSSRSSRPSEGRTTRG